MKQFKSVFLLVAFLVTVTLQSNAQAKDTVSTITGAVITAQIPEGTPIFSGAEKNKVDSLLSIAKAANSTEVRDVLTNAAAQLKDVPKSGSISDWYAYITAALGLIYGLYQYGKRKWSGKDTDVVAK